MAYRRFGDGSRRPETSRLPGLAQNRFRDAEAIDPDRNTAIYRDLGEHRANLVGAQPVAERAADVGLELLHLAERGDHSEVEDRALARGQRLVAPGFAPAILGDDALKIAVEVVGALERAVDVLLAEHLAAHGEAAVVGVLVHGVIPPAFVRARGAPRAGCRSLARETSSPPSPHRPRHWHAPPLPARAPVGPRTRRARTSPLAAGARPRARRP